jgi:carbon monoxide dehydrogenase subunit G
VKLTGTATMHAPPDRVWDALTDPAVLVIAIPGCERLEPAGTDRYLFTITAGLASIQGSYSGEVALTQQRPAEEFVLIAHAAGAPGTVDTRIRIRLTPADADTTALDYDADATVAGLLAGIGQRMLTSLAGRLVAQFVAAVDQAVTGVTGPVPHLVHNVAPTVTSERAPATKPLSTAPAFLTGAVIGAAATAAGVVAGRLFGRRAR